ncbi:hypothetical protein A0V01_05885 (plasmid) [Borrelia hermsii]|uniref:Variable large protein n=1 Tax=Borrelia hermsii TaxID=140 RepID=A0AAN1CFH5_BORHE|nr:hypothetical protein A0V01_05885 [Borrelia hermsii]
MFNSSTGAASDAKKSAADAAKAVGAVTGADILQAMIKDNGSAVKLAENNAAQVAGVNASKDAEVAGGIVLRAMAKDGKFAKVNNGDVDVEKAVKGAAISAVTKALDTLTIAIRKTIDVGLKEVKEAIKINPNDTPLIIDNTTSEAKKN